MGHFQVEAPGRREARKRATRGQLMAAGRELFGRKGLYEARIEDLSESAGIAKGTLYLYFRDKDDLVRQIVEAGYDELRDHVERATADVQRPRALVNALVLAHLDFFRRNPDLLRIFHQLRGMLKFGRPEWRALLAPLDDYIGFLSGTLRRVPSSSWRTPAARRAWSIHLYGAVSGVASVHSILESTRDVREMLPAIVAGLGPAPGRRRTDP